MTRHFAAAAILALAAPLAAENVLEKLPVTLRAGLTETSASASPGEVTLPDLPFSPERGFGHVGGAPGRRLGAAAFGGDSSWPLAWREGMEKYVFRLAQGEYVVEMTFLETEVAAVGLRVFDVIAEDLALKDVDIAREAGDFTWVTLTARVGVLDGWLDLRFEPHTADRPPRISRIRIFRASDPLAATPPAPVVSATGGPRQAVLEWSIPPGSVAGSYEVLRAQSSAGPFEPIPTSALHARRFVDTTIEAGVELHYRVRAHSADGSRSADSNVVSARARRVEDLGIQVMDLKVAEEDLRRAGAQKETAVEVPAELHWLGDVRYVLASLDTSASKWQRKKSFHLTPQIERNRSIRRRKSLFLSAEAGDPTLLRERLSSDAALAAGLAAPSIEPVALLLNGVYQGVYFDVEQLDRRFRTRSRLDRVGVLASEIRGDLLQWDWAPYGEQHGEEGNLIGLTELVHELNRLNEGEMPRFFEDRFYLDRWLDRSALSLVRGSPLLNRFLLEDSRNRRWEAFEEKAPNGTFGVRDFESASPPPGAAPALDILEGRTLSRGSSSRTGPSVLESRLWADPHRLELLSSRLSALLSGSLAAEKLDGLIDAAFARIREAALCDPNRWPRDGGAAFLSGPARIKADLRARAAVLKELAVKLATRAPSSLVLNELLLRPAEGEPWIELRNVSSEPLKLDGYYLTTEFHPRALRFALPGGGALAPGQFLLWRRSGTSGFPTIDADGGFVGLWRQTTPAAPPELLDSIFCGRQSEGLSYGRDAQGAWGFLASPTPSSVTTSQALKPPPYEYRQGVTKEKSGDLKIWLKLREDVSRGDQKPAKVTLKYREEGTQEFQGVDLAWDDKAFQHSIRLAANPNRKRTSYFFLATSAEGVERVYPLPAPRLTFSLPLDAPVKLNEVLPRPSRAAGAPGEFIEVFNTSDAPYDLEGCFLSDSSRNPTRWRIPAGNIVPAKGFAVFLADGANRGNHTGFRLSNSGEFLGLYGRMEEGNLPIDTTAFRGVRTGESWGASPDGTKQFRSWKDPTPGSRNIPKIPADYLKRRQAEAQGAAPPPDDVKPPLEPPEGAVPEPLPEPDDDDGDDDDK